MRGLARISWGKLKIGVEFYWQFRKKVGIKEIKLRMRSRAISCKLQITIRIKMEKKNGQLYTAGL